MGASLLVFHQVGYQTPPENYFGIGLVVPSKPHWRLSDQSTTVGGTLAGLEQVLSAIPSIHKKVGKIPLVILSSVQVRTHVHYFQYFG